MIGKYYKSLTPLRCRHIRLHIQFPWRMWKSISKMNIKKKILISSECVCVCVCCQLELIGKSRIFTAYQIKWSHPKTASHSIFRCFRWICYAFFVTKCYEEKNKKCTNNVCKIIRSSYIHIKTYVKYNAVSNRVKHSHNYVYFISNFLVSLFLSHFLNLYLSLFLSFSFSERFA